jgi:hypothetical protein
LTASGDLIPKRTSFSECVRVADLRSNLRELEPHLADFVLVIGNPRRSQLTAPQ